MALNDDDMWNGRATAAHLIEDHTPPPAAGHHPLETPRGSVRGFRQPPRPARQEDALHWLRTEVPLSHAFLNGEQVYDQGNASTTFYQSVRLRDRPFVNTGWELVINQQDEVVNQDIDLDSVDDIRLYLFYTDFTTL